jgi:hypothetical protein
VSQQFGDPPDVGEATAEDWQAEMDMMAAEGERGMTESDHERIWLEPGPGGYEGRLWCQDDVWADNSDYAGYGPPTEYIRADLFNAAVDAAREEGRREERERCGERRSASPADDPERAG